MPWTLATIVLALAAAAPSPMAAPRITYTEGAVSAGDRGIQSQNGRAEALMPDGSVVHVDRHSLVAFAGGQQLELRSGRLFLHTTSRGYIDIDLSIARVELTPRGVYSILFDPARETLLVSVAVGHADIRSAQGVTQVVGREMAMMIGAQSRPYATPLDPARWDSFEQWSDDRMNALAYGPQSPWTGSDLWRAGLVVEAPPPGAPPCGGWLEWNNPCVVIAPPFVTPGPSPHATSREPGPAPVDGARDGGGLLGPRPRGAGGAKPDAAAPAPEVKPLPRSIETRPGPTAAPPARGTPKPAGGTAVGRPRS
jgi:hypothetical protein